MFGAHRLTTTRADGDFRIDAPPAELASRRRALVDLPWVWLRQVHGADVLVVADRADAVRVAGRAGDALVTSAGWPAAAMPGPQTRRTPASAGSPALRENTSTRSATGRPC